MDAAALRDEKAEKKAKNKRKLEGGRDGTGPKLKKKPKQTKDGKPVMALSRQEKEDKSAKFLAKKDGDATTAETILEINKLWEKQRSKANTDEESTELCGQVFELVQGRVFEMALKHDASRALQATFDRGTAQHRTDIISELKGHMRDLCMSKYGRQVLLKILRVCAKDKAMLVPVFTELLGFTRKLLTHKVAGAVINCMYGEVGTPEQRGRMVLDCCGREISVMVDEAQSSINLAEIFEKQPKKKAAVLGRIHDLLLTLAQKQSIQSQLGLHLLCEYVKHAEHVDRIDVLQAVAPMCEAIVEAGGSKEAEAALFDLLSYGGAKERKIVMKALKGNWADMALREHGHRAVMRALDVIDDTTMLRKTVVADILDDDKITEICTHKYGRRVLLHLLAPRDTTFFDQYTISIMQPTFVPATKEDGDDAEAGGEEGRMVPTSKKDPDTRRRELLPEVAPKLLAWCTEYASNTLCQSTTADVAVALLKQTDLGSFIKGAAGAEAVTGCLQALASATVVERAAATKKGAEGLAASACNDYVGRKTIRRLLELPSVGAEFGSLLLEVLGDGVLLQCATLRGGRFVVEALLISEQAQTKDAVVEVLATKAAEKAMAASDEGVLRTLGALLGFKAPAASAAPKSNKRKAQGDDETPPMAKKKAAGGKKAKAKAKAPKAQAEEEPAVRRSARGR